MNFEPASSDHEMFGIPFINSPLKSVKEMNETAFKIKVCFIDL